MYYTANSIESRLETLTFKMLQKSGTDPPKLRARGAEARGLVKFVCDEAAAELADDVAIEATIKAAASYLKLMYDNLSAAAFSHEALSESSRKFAVLWKALDEATPEPYWRMKPKLHLMQELCEISKSCPSTTWLYRDEDFGGSIANLTRIRGGKATAKRVGFNVLMKFFARNALPSL